MKKLLALLFCLVLEVVVVISMPNQAEAATVQETGNAILQEALAMQFPTDGSDYPARCPHCDTNVTWKALPLEITSTITDAGHYYLQGNTKATGATAAKVPYQYFSTFNGGSGACLHMNGYNLTGSRARGAFVALNKTFTIMGNGIFASPATSGSRGTLFANNGTINVYGTTVTTTANNGEPVLSLYTSGTTINVWGATLSAGTNPAISTNGTVNIYNTTFEGGVAVEQDDPVGGNGSTARINLVDSNLPGVKKEIGTVTVAGNTKITGTGLELATGETVDPTKLTEGASIAIGSEGTFTAANMASYIKYFTSANTTNKLTARTDGSLAVLGPKAYGLEIIEKANAMIDTFSGEHKAVCPVCDVEVTWKPLTSRLGTNFDNNGHYYLANSITINGQIFQFTGAQTVCLHTNGKTLTDETYRITITGAGSQLNIMGGGTIVANTSGNRGILYSNNSSTINVFGTNLKNTATTVSSYGNACITLRSTNGVANVWSSNLEGSSVSPAILTNGVVNLYNCTVTGSAAQVGNYDGQGDSKANLNLVDSTVIGVDVQDGKITVSGNTKIGAIGLKLAEGKTVDPSKLTAGASIAIADECAFTGAGMADYAKYFTAAKTGQEITVTGNGTLRCWKPRAVLVATNGAETVSDDILTDWSTGNYAYIKLYGEDTLVLTGQDIVVDLNGRDLIVTGTGNIRGFDTANDAYDASACGNILNNGSVTFTQSVIAPNGNTYVAVKESNRTTLHRIEIKLTSVSLRTTAAGLYYKAKYTCDDVLAEKVVHYGVVVSVFNMPGADFATEETEGNNNAWTKSKTPFQSGVTATSGSIFGIMKDTREAELNDAYARTPIYANAYVDFGDGPVVADTANAGLTVNDSSFKGVGLSLFDVLGKLDDAYNGYNTTTRLQLDDFYFQWKDKGMDWDFDYIGKTAGTTDAIDNSDIELKFDEGTTNAVCPVCNVKVTWTALTVKDTQQNLNGHYYLPSNLTFENTGDAFFFNGTTGKTLCVHLNGHNITATQTRVVHGSNGRTNIMGNGIVTGYQKSADYGAAVQINNMVPTNGVHLYGGTYRKTANSSSGAAPIAVSNAGGEINVYAGAIIDNSGGAAIIVRTPVKASNGSIPPKSNLGLYGATVNGNVILFEGSIDLPTTNFVTEFVDCKINGNLQIGNYREVYLSGAPVINSVTLDDDVLLNTKVLNAGASIGIASKGVFTVAGESMKNYTQYFRGTEAVDVITVRGNALHCGPDYAGDLKFAEGTTDAMCPACGKVVTWVAADSSERIVCSSSSANKHYYLADDITYTANDTGVLSYITPGHGSYNFCFHLNGHDLTLTDTRMIYGGTSTSNIMGTGTVTGIRSDGYAPGAVIQINTNNANGTVNLWSGTYRQGESGANTNTDFTVSISGNGGIINIHEDATVESNANGRAVYVGNSNLQNSKLGIYGKVVGTVYSEGANQSSVDAKGQSRTVYSTEITADGCDIRGVLDINGVSSLKIGRAAKIELLDMEPTSLAVLDTLKPGASITVLKEGTFTQPSSNTADYLAYFKPANKNDIIQVRDSALYYKVNYTGNVYPDTEGNAYCPVCKTTVNWTPVSSGAASLAAEDNKHYYLTADIIYEGAYDAEGAVSFFSGPGSNQKACLHLNGHNITSTKSHGIYGGWGVLNVMGNGIVTGWTDKEAQNAAAQINNSLAGNALNLYGGTYRKSGDSNKLAAVVGVNAVGSTLRIYEDVDISNPDGRAMYIGSSIYRNTFVEVYGATINGDIIAVKPSGTEGDYNAQITFKNVTVNGTTEIATGNDITMDGCTKIGKLVLGEGVVATFSNMESGSDITVSAEGIFSGVMPLADEWLKYITCADTGDWIIVRDKQFYQEEKQQITTASDDDKAALDATYDGMTVKYGEMHDHSNATTRADGNNSLLEWKAEMDRLNLEFANIMDHGQSQHMYHPDWDDTYFVGGSEPGTTITDSKAGTGYNKPHYNMIFADEEKLEELVLMWQKVSGKTQKSKFVISYDTTGDSRFTEGLGGFLFSYPSYTTAEFGQLAQDIYAMGGLFVQVHPKYDSYIYSDDPMDYFFADYTGLEITTGSGGNMMAKNNNEAYDLWVDLLELGKKVWATAGSDKHRLPNITGLTTLYSAEDHADTYMELYRQGNMAPGWVGIRMNVNGTAMGGETDFTGKRLQFSVGDIYNTGVADAYNTPAPYVEGHIYRVELYDDGGLLMTSYVDPTEMNYFAIDCDATAKFYRVVVWDETDNERIGVGNPIWNTAK